MKSTIPQPVAGHKWCGRCKRWKLNQEFGKCCGRLRECCKVCFNDYKNKWRREHPELHKAAQRRAREKLAKDPQRLARANQLRRISYGRDYRKDWCLRRTYGITLADYDEIVRSQNRLCALCGKPPIDGLLRVDHCHDTGKIRGLVCHKCNGGIGLLGDDLESVRKAVAYLERSAQDDIEWFI